MRVSNRHQRSLGSRAAYFDSLERRQLLAATSGLPIELHVWAGATWTSDSLDRAVQPGDSVAGTRTPAGYRAGGAFGLAPTITLGSDVAIAGTTDDALFRVQRQAYALTFASPAANGDYVAIVEFAEPDAAAVVGSRVFDITAEGRPFATHVDPAAILGGPDAAIALAGRVTIADGQFDLSFAATAGQAIVSSVTLVPTAIPDATTAAFDVSNHTDAQRTLLGEAGLAAIGRAIVGYANEQRNNMPPDLGFLAVDQDVPLADFVDPRGPSRAPRGTLSDLERQAVVRSLGDYVYVRSSKLPTRNSATTVIAYENPTRVAGDLNALYADGHVATVARAALGAAVGFDPTLPPTSTARRRRR